VSANQYTDRLGVLETAKLLGVHYNTVRGMVRRGVLHPEYLPSMGKRAGAMRFDPDEVKRVKFERDQQQIARMESRMVWKTRRILVKGLELPWVWREPYGRDANPKGCVLHNPTPANQMGQGN